MQWQLRVIGSNKTYHRSCYPIFLQSIKRKLVILQFDCNPIEATDEEWPRFEGLGRSQGEYCSLQRAAQLKKGLAIEPFGRTRTTAQAAWLQTNSVDVGVGVYNRNVLISYNAVILCDQFSNQSGAHAILI